MSTSIWTVRPEQTEPIDLVYVSPRGERVPFWIRLKKRLTIGEARKITTAGWRGVRNVGAEGSEVQIDWQSQSFARAETWVTDWSLEDDDRKRLPITRAVIESLEGDVFQLIENAITAHIEAVEEEKKLPSGMTSPSATSGS